MKLKGLRSTLTVQRELTSNPVGYLLSFQKNQSDLRYSSMTSQRQAAVVEALTYARRVAEDSKYG